VVVDIERGRTIEGWKPRRLGGGKGGRPKVQSVLTSSSTQIADSRSHSKTSYSDDYHKSEHRRSSRDRKRSRSRSRDRKKRSKSRGMSLFSTRS
jgi:U1 small nuclear ribonucleoprotein 70kDa